MVPPEPHAVTQAVTASLIALVQRICIHLIPVCLASLQSLQGTVIPCVHGSFLGWIQTFLEQSNPIFGIF